MICWSFLFVCILVYLIADRGPSEKLQVFYNVRTKCRVNVIVCFILNRYLTTLIFFFLKKFTKRANILLLLMRCSSSETKGPAIVNSRQKIFVVLITWLVFVCARAAVPVAYNLFYIYYRFSNPPKKEGKQSCIHGFCYGMCNFSMNECKSFWLI